MKVILLKDVGGVGKRDDIKELSDGYVLNFLIPRGLAVQASPAKIKELEAKKTAAANSVAEQTKEWESYAHMLKDAVIEVQARANAQGHLYRQLTAQDIVSALQSRFGITIPDHAIVLNTPIKSVAESTVDIKLGKHATRVRIVVKAA